MLARLRFCTINRGIRCSVDDSLRLVFCQCIVNAGRISDIQFAARTTNQFDIRLGDIGKLLPELPVAARNKNAHRHHFFLPFFCFPLRELTQQCWQRFIFGRQQWIADRPLNADGWIIPQHADFVTRLIIFGALVKKICIV
jgi:hypothetical protein